MQTPEMYVAVWPDFQLLAHFWRLQQGLFFGTCDTRRIHDDGHEDGNLEESLPDAVAMFQICD